MIPDVSFLIHEFICVVIHNTLHGTTRAGVRLTFLFNRKFIGITTQEVCIDVKTAPSLSLLPPNILIKATSRPPGASDWMGGEGWEALLTGFLFWVVWIWALKWVMRFFEFTPHRLTGLCLVAKGTHTALTDIKESVKELRYYQGAIFKPPQGRPA